LETTVGIRPEIRLELRQILSIQQILLQMDMNQLSEFVIESLEKRGLKQTESILNFVLAGRVKNAVPHLSWPQARHLARKISSIGSHR